MSEPRASVRPADQSVDPSTTGTVIELEETPDLTPMLGRVALGAIPIPGRGTPRSAELPDTTVVLRGVTADADQVAEYADVCGFRVASTLPVTYLHMLGFPLSVQLMTRPDFPFGLMGMVHVRNTITAHRPVGLDETVDVTAGVINLRPHPKGRQMDNIVTVSVAGDTVWESVSTYLKRGSGASDSGTSDSGASETGPDVDVEALPLTSRWTVPADIGRRYGAVSGDRNPIHMSGLTAKAFGFPRAIAHGMWTKARCLAALEGRLPDSYTVDVAFKLPLLLPGRVEYATRATADGWSFGVRSRDGRPHLAGTIAGR